MDRWLWAVRLFPSRTAATEACRAGHVKVNGTTAKPATQVSVGDRIVVRTRGRERVVEVARIVPTRVGAPIAAECLVDHSPPPALPESVPRREGKGRPTKRERRQLDRLRGRHR